MKVSRLIEICGALPEEMVSRITEPLGIYKKTANLPDHHIEMWLYEVVVQEMKRAKKPFCGESVVWLINQLNDRRDDMPHQLVRCCESVLGMLVRHVAAREVMDDFISALTAAHSGTQEVN